MSIEIQNAPNEALKVPFLGTETSIADAEAVVVPLERLEILAQGNTNMVPRSIDAKKATSPGTVVHSGETSETKQGKDVQKTDAAIEAGTVSFGLAIAFVPAAIVSGFVPPLALVLGAFAAGRVVRLEEGPMTAVDKFHYYNAIVSAALCVGLAAAAFNPLIGLIAAGLFIAGISAPTAIGKLLNFCTGGLAGTYFMSLFNSGEREARK